VNRNQTTEITKTCKTTLADNTFLNPALSLALTITPFIGSPLRSPFNGKFNTGQYEHKLQAGDPNPSLKDSTFSAVSYKKARQRMNSLPSRVINNF